MALNKYIYKDYQLNLSGNPLRVEYSDEEYEQRKRLVDDILKSIFSETGLFLDTEDIYNVKITYQYTDKGPRLEWKGDLYLKKNQPGIIGLKWKDKESAFQSTSTIIDDEYIYLNNGSNTYSNADWRWLNLFEIAEVIDPTFCYLWDNSQNKVSGSFFGVEDSVNVGDNVCTNITQPDLKAYNVDSGNLNLGAVNVTTYSRFGMRDKAATYLTFVGPSVNNNLYDGQTNKIISGQHGVRKDKAQQPQETVKYWATSDNNPIIRVAVNDFNKKSGSTEPVITWSDSETVTINGKEYKVKEGSKVIVFRRSAVKPVNRKGCHYRMDGKIQTVDPDIGGYFDMYPAASTFSSETRLKNIKNWDDYIPTVEMDLYSLNLEQKTYEFNSTQNWGSIDSYFLNFMRSKEQKETDIYSISILNYAVGRAQVSGWSSSAVRFRFTLKWNTFSFLDEFYPAFNFIEQKSPTIECAAKTEEPFQSRKTWAKINFNFYFPDGFIPNKDNYCRILSQPFYYTNSLGEITNSARVCLQWTETLSENMAMRLRKRFVDETTGKEDYGPAIVDPEHNEAITQSVILDGNVQGIIPAGNIGYTVGMCWNENNGNQAGLDMVMVKNNNPGIYTYAVIIM